MKLSCHNGRYLANGSSRSEAMPLNFAAWLIVPGDMMPNWELPFPKRILPGFRVG